jgi:endoglucanase
MCILKTFFLAIFFILNIFCKKNTTTTKTSLPDNTPNNFLHRSGKTIVDGNNKVFKLRGVSFGNEVWSDKEVSAVDHNEEDFKRIKEMGMNVIRFYMNYKTFESDNAPYKYKEAGWQWIDQNIVWAKKYNIQLILNMHIPQGGFQAHRNGDALWDVTENQNRLTALWKAIATKYKTEPQIAGFGLVNEPIPTVSKEKWQQLAQRITNEIRTADKQHIIFAEQAISVKGIEGEDADLNFPIINDENLVYEFHIYNPYQFTHQLLDWNTQGEGGKYPDENIIISDKNSWYTGTFNNPAIESGDNDWKFFEGEKYKVADAKIKLGSIALVGTGVTGKVYFDDVVIKEYDPSGNFVQDIVKSDLDSEDGWGFWSKNNTGSKGFSDQIGHSNNKSIFITGATDDCLTSNYDKLFIPQQNYSYQINGWMKGENIAAAAGCRLRIDFLSSEQPVYHRNKELLEAVIKKFTDWASVKNVPLYMGEFGTGYPCFKNNKGGIQWVTDMIDIANKNGISFTYHAYRGDDFGLYLGSDNLPDATKVNQPLIDLFKAKLK